MWDQICGFSGVVRLGRLLAWDFENVLKILTECLARGDSDPAKHPDRVDSVRGNRSGICQDGGVRGQDVDHRHGCQDVVLLLLAGSVQRAGDR